MKVPLPLRYAGPISIVDYLDEVKLHYYSFHLDGFIHDATSTLIHGGNVMMRATFFPHTQKMFVHMYVHAS